MVNPIQFGILIILLCMTQLSHAFSVSVSKTKVSVNESIVVTIELAGRHQRDKIDLAPFKQQFRIFNSRVQHFYAHPNWNSRWTITLLAKKAGIASIPALTIDNQSTKAIPITVNSSNNHQNALVILTNTVDRNEAYPQSQIILTQTLYQRPHVASGILSEPKIPQAIVKRLTEDETSETKRRGVRYNMIKRRYAIFPQQPGLLEIPKSQFSGLIERRSDMMVQSFMRQNNKVSASSEAITVTVLPIPSPFTQQDWVATPKLTISAQWQQESQFKTGEPKIKIITLTAAGLFGTQLPNLHMPHSEDFKYYLEEIKTDTTQTEQGLVGTKLFHLTYIPLKVGQLSIPEIKKKWWNTNTKQAYTTTIPAQTIDVIEGKWIQKNVALDWQNHSTAPAPIDEPDPTANLSFWDDVVNNLPSLDTVFLACCLFALLMMVKHWFSPEKKQQLLHEMKEKVSSRFAYNIKKGCQTQDNHYVYEQLILWANSKWPEKQFDNLGQIADFIANAEFNKKIAKLNRSLFTTEHAGWNGKSFWRVFKTIVNQTTTATPSLKPAPTLPSLYTAQQSK